jgi:plasmid maintenance system antidote protein VapI
MSTTLTQPKPKQRKKRHLPHTPNYIYLMPPGEVLEEKMFEMGIDAAELARRMKVPVETIEKLLHVEIPLTESVAKKIEKATWMNANLMMRHEKSYRAKLAYAMEHPEIPAYLGDEIINQPKRARKKKTAEPQS